MASEGYHEPLDKLSSEVMDHHRAIVSLMEELEAVDWYHQRAHATDDPELAEILVHNRDEEKEHAVMTLEWLRRRDPVLDRLLRTYLFAEGPIVDVEEEATNGGAPGTGTAEPAPPPAGGLAIGSLRHSDETF